MLTAAAAVDSGGDTDDDDGPKTFCNKVEENIQVPEVVARRMSFQSQGYDARKDWVPPVHGIPGGLQILSPSSPQDTLGLKGLSPSSPQGTLRAVERTESYQFTEYLGG